MRDETEKLVQKAARALHAAELLFREGDMESAASRAYYAMFYAAEALLRESGLSFRKHAGVHAAFGERFAKSGLIDPKLHRWLLDAFDRRIQADYGIDILLTREDITTMIEQAGKFIHETVQFLSA